MNWMPHCVGSVSVRSEGPAILPQFPPAALGTPMCSCAFCLGKMPFWTWFWFCLCITSPAAAPTTWFCTVVVSELGFEAIRAVNPLLMGCGLAESSGKGRKSQLWLPRLSNTSLEGFVFFFCSWAVPGYSRQKKDDVCVTKGCSTGAELMLTGHVQKQPPNTSVSSLSQRKPRP